MVLIISTIINSIFSNGNVCVVHRVKQAATLQVELDHGKAIALYGQNIK